MKKKNNNNWKMLLVVFFSLFLLLIGCGPKKEVGSEHSESSEISASETDIFYHADEGELDNTASVNVKNMTKEQAIADGKTIITFAFSGSENDVLTYAVKGFNQESENYFVDMRLLSMGNPKSGDERLRIQTEVGSGAGPDIVSVDVFPVDTKVLEKGTFVDLAPYMKECEITEEKYFPCYANLKCDEKIYGICPTGFVNLWTIDKKVLGGKDAIDIYKFVDCLQNYSGEACLFYQGESGNSIVKYLLQGSRSLWGMVNWEKRTCDFSGDFFAEILRVAKRYSENGQKGYEPLMTYVTPYPGAYAGNQAIEEEGLAFIGNFFDDGCYPTYVEGSTFMINSNSKNVAGAWSFLSYLMSKKGQNMKFANSSAHRELFTESMQESFRLVEEGKMQFKVEMSPQIMDDIIDIYNRGRYLPRENEEILSIIWEEAESYFVGDKNIAAVCDMIQNRVQLMLNE